MDIPNALLPKPARMYLCMLCMYAFIPTHNLRLSKACWQTILYTAQASTEPAKYGIGKAGEEHTHMHVPVCMYIGMYLNMYVVVMQHSPT